MIAFGSGDPTRAICSELIAQSFEAVGYPVLPDVTYLPAPLVDCPDCVEQIMRVRHHSLYVPRDFDVSPYFEIVKPSLEAKFDFHILNWARGRLLKRQMLFLLGQRAAKIALHDLQDRALWSVRRSLSASRLALMIRRASRSAALSAASTTSAHVFALACFISASVRLASSRMRLRSRSVKPAALSARSSVKRLAKAAGNASRLA